MNVLVLNAPYFPRFSRPQRSPAVTKSGTIYYPIWLAYAVGVLEHDNFNVTFLDAPAQDLEMRDVLDAVRQTSPSLVVMDVATPSIDNDLAVAADIRLLAPDTTILTVGTHVSALPEDTLTRSDVVDAVARREYEMTVLDLARAIRTHKGKPPDDVLASILGLSYRTNDGTIAHNEDRPFIEDLDTLPWVSRVYKKHLRIEDYFNPNAIPPMVTLITSRGCPFRCSFCVYPQTLTGRKYRFRSLSDVVTEIRYVKQEFPHVKSIFFEDDTLTANKKRCMAFSRELIRQNLNISWTANSRVDLDYETMALMKRAGCRMLCVGFESGDPKILRGMKKGIRRERMFQFMRDAKKAGILIHGCFIFGFPGETRESIERTIDLSIQLDPDTVQYYPVMVYPGTEAYDEYLEKEWITVDDFSRWLTPDGLHNCVVRNENLTPEELVRLCDRARRRFYLRPEYMGKKFLQVLTDSYEMRRTFKASRTFIKHLIFGSKV